MHYVGCVCMYVHRHYACVSTHVYKVRPPPGWVCYAEKTHGSFVLPYISTTKSPQQVIGSLVKHHLAQREGKTYVLTRDLAPHCMHLQ